jgi:hypothetical protein
MIQKLKNQNGGIIQDGDENIFLIFWLGSLYFILALELQHINIDPQIKVEEKPREYVESEYNSVCSVPFPLPLSHKTDIAKP